MKETAREFAKILIDPRFDESTKDWEQLGGEFALGKKVRLSNIEKAARKIEARDRETLKEAADIAVKDCEDACKVCGILNCGDCQGCAKLRAAIMKE